MDSDDEYIVQQFSDEGGIDSSDDDELVMKEFLNQSKSGKKFKKSVQDFETEMSEELERTVQALLAKENFNDPRKSLNLVSRDTKLNDKYFDTDSEEDNNEESSAQASSNVELFYDPQMDMKDEEFVDKKTSAYRNKLQIQSKQQSLPNSDAVLNCPACFTTLCRDCQRHDKYKTQYRAMFTFHCEVNMNEPMRIPPQTQQSRTRKNVGNSANYGNFQPNHAEEIYHPVRCTVCNTHVAMFDHDEVYHFFNVVTSH